VEFQYDPSKNKSNRRKHGIDFDQAKALWEDEDRLEFPAKSTSEPRSALLAKRNGKVWAAFFTMRGSVIRIISVRRARENEEKTYYES
jgi:uncharacterized DUF497 family protein